MAHASLFHSRKLVRLTMRLARLDLCTMPELVEALAVGILEKLWDWSYREESPELGTAEEIEYKLAWRGEPGELVEAIAGAGFLDQAGDTYVVHDWVVHLPESIRKRIRRKGGLPDDGGQTADNVRQTAPNGGHRPPLGGQRPDNVRQTAPFGAERPPPGGQCPPTEAEAAAEADPPPCPPSRGERQQRPEEPDAFELFTATVETIWAGYRGGTFGPKDAAVVEELFSQGVDADTVERVILEHLGQDGRPVDASGNPVRTFRWFRQAILERWARMCKMRGPDAPEPEPICVSERLQALAARAPTPFGEAIRRLDVDGAETQEVEEHLAEIDRRMVETTDKRLDDAGRQEIVRRVAAAMARLQGRFGSGVAPGLAANLRERILRAHLHLPVLSLFSADADPVGRDPPAETPGADEPNELST